MTCWPIPPGSAFASFGAEAVCANRRARRRRQTGRWAGASPTRDSASDAIPTRVVARGWLLQAGLALGVSACPPLNDNLWMEVYVPLLSLGVIKLCKPGVRVHFGRPHQPLAKAPEIRHNLDTTPSHLGYDTLAKWVFVDAKCGRWGKGKWPKLRHAICEVRN